MRDGQAGLGHPPWRGGGVRGLATAEAGLRRGTRGGLKRDLKGLRLEQHAMV